MQDFLKGPEVNSRYKSAPLKFSRRIFTASRPGGILAADTAFVRSQAEHNDGLEYLIIILNIFSEYLFVKLVKYLKSAFVIKAVEDVLNQLVWYLPWFNSDEGSEFVNKAFKSYLAS